MFRNRFTSKDFLKLINDLNFPFFKINYDTGNSASMGYDFKEELQTYAQYITNIHIKDRVFKGGSVILELVLVNLMNFLII